MLPCGRPCRPTSLEILLAGVLLVGALLKVVLLVGALLKGVLLVGALLVRQGLW